MIRNITVALRGIRSLESVVQYCNADELIREEGKGKMPMECPELSDSDEEFLESMIAVNSSDCTTNQLQG